MSATGRRPALAGALRVGIHEAVATGVTTRAERRFGATVRTER